MTKQDLRKKWSKYCDTDKLVDDMCELLKQYRHPHTVNGVCKLLDKYFENKEPLIKLFITSNHYIGDMRISLKKEFERQISANEIRAFFCNFHEKFYTTEMLQHTDKNGKTFLDYLTVNKNYIGLDDLPSEEKQKSRKKNLDVFCYDNMATRESTTRYDDFCGYMRYFAGLARASVPSDYQYNPDNEKNPMLKHGTKTSRAFNNVCKHYGADKLHPQVVMVEKDEQLVPRTVYPYDKLFAQYSDLVSDLKRKMDFVISLNPLDYLTMSFGVSWKSCHNIRDGGWKGGCLSYMLDCTSMITYVVDKAEGKVHEIPKLYRQMYHYDNHLFVQNRLYPQGNDGATDLYEKFRNFVIEEFTELLNVDGEWGCDVGRSVTSNHVYSQGTHYKDYNSNSSCSIFYPMENAKTALAHVMTIGHTGICVNCGEEFSNGSYLAHPYGCR